MIMVGINFKTQKTSQYPKLLEHKKRQLLLSNKSRIKGTQHLAFI